LLNYRRGGENFSNPKIYKKIFLSDCLVRGINLKCHFIEHIFLIYKILLIMSGLIFINNYSNLYVVYIIISENYNFNFLKLNDNLVLAYGKLGIL